MDQENEIKNKDTEDSIVLSIPIANDILFNEINGSRLDSQNQQAEKYQKL